MKRFVIPAILLFVLLFVYSCHEIAIEIADPEIPASDRVVLLEELTGASCPNCPKGSAAIENLLAKFPGKVAAIAIHGDFLAKPTAKSKYDFRNQKAKDLENWFTDWFGKPAASINRTPDNSGTIMIDLPDLWQAAVENELKKTHQMNILLDTNFDPVSRRMDLEVAVIPLVDLAGNYNISIYLIESGIVDAQSNGAVIIDEFTHNHVLRDMLTRFDGDNFSTDLKKEAILKKNYTYTLPVTADGLWRPEHMEVVVMVSRNAPSDISVIQAATGHVME